MREEIKKIRKELESCQEESRTELQEELNRLVAKEDKYIAFSVACDGVPPYYEGAVSNCSADRMGACKINYENDEDLLHVWLKRPGLLIGKAGSNIKKVEEYIGCKIQIHEVKNLWDWD